MNTLTPASDDPWSLLHDLIFGIPHPILGAVEEISAVLLVAAFAALVTRVWRGDRVAVGPLSIARPDIVGRLETALADLSRDDKLKANVFWMFRERLNEANRIIDAGIEEPFVHEWCRGVLTDTVTALSEGGHDRHRASLWIKTGDELRMYDGMGFRQDAIDRATLPLDSIAGNVVVTGMSHTSNDVNDDRAFSPKPRSGPPYRSLLAVPVKAPSTATIAALCVDAESRGYFDRDHEFFAACFADLIALLVAQVIKGDES